MKPNDSKILHQRKEDLSKRLERKQWPEQEKPLLRAQNIHYEMAEKVRAIDCGGKMFLSLYGVSGGRSKYLRQGVTEGARRATGVTPCWRPLDQGGPMV